MPCCPSSPERGTSLNTVRLSTLAALAAALFASTAAAQRQRGLVDVSPTSDRHGLWMDIGLGWGIESYKFGNESYVDGLGKPTFNFKIGGTVNPNVRLGGEVNVWWNAYQDESGYDVDETLTNVMAIGRFYPTKTMGLFLKGGAGLGITTASVEYGNSTTETASPPSSAPSTRTHQGQRLPDEDEQQEYSPPPQGQEVRRRAVIEALLFVAGEAVALAHLAKATELREPEVKRVVAELQADYKARGSGVGIIEIADSYRMVTDPDF